MTLTCPKCQAQMRTYERNGVHVDQCTECRGIFLDRGELEQLVDAENSWGGSSAPGLGGPPPQQQGGAVAPPPQHQQQRGWGGGSFDSPDDRRGYGGQPGYAQGGYGKPPKKKRARSFLEDLFEG